MKCRNCGGDFQRKVNAQKYCSPACAKPLKKSRTMECRHCRKAFEATRSNQQYCSQRCQKCGEGMRARERSRLIIGFYDPRPCASCGVEYQRTLGNDRSGYKYCSPACADQGQRAKSRAGHLRRYKPTGRSQVRRIGRRKEVTCEYCQTVFKVRPSAKHRFCGLKCAARWQADQVRRPVSTCKWCGKKYWPKDTDRIHYCSKKCSYEAHRYLCGCGKPKERDKKRCAVCDFPQIPIRYRKACAVCSSEFSASRIEMLNCSEECQREYARIREFERNKAAYDAAAKYSPCGWCGRIFKAPYGTKTKRCCSTKCGRRLARTNGQATRRARLKGAKVIERVDVIALCKTARWRCQNCGKETPLNLRGKHKHNSPEIDHVVPIKMGGNHTANNLQLLCRKCNQDFGGMYKPCYSGIWKWQKDADHHRSQRT